ncbi:MAG: histidine phosphatase family protein [Deltaproteobacteria bacterium]|nr:histidine phosphatase family protein [Deltaproteobacteria bacterium]
MTQAAAAQDESSEPGTQARREARQREEALAHVILLRHGEPDWYPGGNGAVDDAGLTARGQAQARCAAAALARERVDAIYVSPLLRAQETAAPLVAATGIPAITVPAFAEIAIAGTAGLSQRDVDRYFLEAMRRPLAAHWDGWPQGESFRAFHSRVCGGLGEVLARHGMSSEREREFTVWDQPARPQTIVVVAHGGTNAVLLTHLLDVAPVPWEWIRFESELAAYSVVQARPLGQHGCIWSLIDFGEVDHLRAAGLR